MLEVCVWLQFSKQKIEMIWAFNKGINTESDRCGKNKIASISINLLIPIPYFGRSCRSCWYAVNKTHCSCCTFCPLFFLVCEIMPDMGNPLLCAACIRTIPHSVWTQLSGNCEAFLYMSVSLIIKHLHWLWTLNNLRVCSCMHFSCWLFLYRYTYLYCLCSAARLYCPS